MIVTHVHSTSDECATRGYLQNIYPGIFA